jgi:outer membrane protein OmpA-like peptidoglycan-associated protein
MQSSARWIAILALPFLISTLAFAGDSAKPAASPQEASATDSAGTAPAPPAAAPAAQAKESSSGMRGPDTPGGELFFGYSYLRLNTTTGVFVPVPRTVDENFDFIPGGAASLQGNVNNWFGLKGEFGGYSLRDVRNVDGRVYTYLFGPVFSLRRHKFTFFVHTLVGGARITEDVPVPFVSTTTFFARGKFHQNSFAGDGGLGLDWNVGRHVAIRLFQGDYLYTQFNDFHNDQQNNVRGSAGLVFHFAYPAAAPPAHHPPTATCTANPTSVQEGSGATVAVRADAASPDNLPLTYTWSPTGGTVDGTGPEVHWNLGTAAPGTYTLTARVDDSKGGTVSCSAVVQVTPKPILPPTLSCAAASTSVPVGQRVAITATASDPQNLPLTYTWQSSGGQVVGSGAQVQFDTTGIAAGHYTINGHVDNGKGGTADCKVDIDVQIPVEQKQLEEKLTLHSVFFPTAQPTVQNPNGGLLPSQQRTLLTAASDFKKYLTFKPEAHLILTGHADPRGKPEYNQALSERRVARVKAFLVEQGVPADHIETQGLGEEQPLSAEMIAKLAAEDETLTPDQRTRITKNAKAVALAQNRRVDLTLSTTGQTSTRKYPFNAEDVLNLISPRGPAGAAPARKPAPRRKRPAPAPTPR